MSIQGFTGGLMQGYSFMQDQYDRRDRRQRLDRQESRADKRLGMQEGQYSYERELAEEERAWQKKQRSNQERLRKVMAAQHKLQNGVPLSPEDEQAVGFEVQDPKTRKLMEYVDKNPRDAYNKANNITLAYEGKGDLKQALDASNELFSPWIQQGEGNNKRISNLKPISGKVFAELEYEDEEGNLVTGAPLTANRGKKDAIVREIDVGQALSAAEAIKQLAALRIQLGDTSPITAQQESTAAKADYQRELGLKAFQHGLDVRKDSLNNASKEEIARIKNQAEQSGLGKMPSYIEQAFTTPVVDEEGNLIRDVNGNPQYQADPGALAGLSQFALENNIKNWDDAYRYYNQAMRQRQAQARQQQQQEQEQQQINEQAGKVVQLIESGDIERAQRYMQGKREQAPDVYRSIINTLPEEVRKALEQEVRPEPKKEYTLKKGINDATTKARGVADKAVQTGRGLSQWMDDINIKWK